LAEINIFFIIISSIGFDLLIGDPEIFLHPVQVIGIYIKKTTNFFIKNFEKNKVILFLSGFLISISTISVSFFTGKFIEIQLNQPKFNLIFTVFLFLGLSSCLATKGLISSVKDISNSLSVENEGEASLALIKKKVQKIVSRDVSKSDKTHLLRSATESLTENAVDGVFGPLFWIFIGAISIKYSPNLPGPLSLGFTYKAISTLDSMIGYKYGAYKYIGYFSAKIEDIATFVPSRLVVITLPLIQREVSSYFNTIKKVFSDGSKYESPNSGISEAIFAYLVNIRLGGENEYANGISIKPEINREGNPCSNYSIEYICQLIIRLEIMWTVIFTLIFYLS